MKVGIVELVENEMAELDVVQIGSNWGWGEVEGEDEGDYEGVYRGDTRGVANAKKISPAASLHPPLHPPLHPLPNQSKPIVPTPSLSLL